MKNSINSCVTKVSRFRLWPCSEGHFRLAANSHTCTFFQKRHREVVGFESSDEFSTGKALSPNISFVTSSQMNRLANSRRDGGVDFTGVPSENDYPSGFASRILLRENRCCTVPVMAGGIRTVSRTMLIHPKVLRTISTAVTVHCNLYGCRPLVPKSCRSKQKCA